MGTFILGISINAPILAFSNLQLRILQATDQNNKYCFSEYLSLRIATLLLTLVIILLTFCSNYDFDTKLVIIGVGLSKVIESLSDIFFGLFQKVERMEIMSISLMVKGVISLSIFLIVMNQSGNLLLSIVLMTISWLIILLIFDIPNGLKLLSINSLRDLNLFRDRIQLFQMISDAAPLGIVTGLMSLETNIPRYFVEYYFGGRELGIFASIYYVMMTGQIVIISISQSAIPRIAKYFHNGNYKDIRKLLIRLTSYVFLICIFLICCSGLFGKEILTIIYTESYAYRSNLFFWITIALCIEFVNILLAAVLRGMCKFKSLLYVKIFSIGFLLTMCFFFVEKTKSVLGISTALILNSLVSLLVYSLLLIYFLQIKKTEQLRNAG